MHEVAQVQEDLLGLQELCLVVLVVLDLLTLNSWFSVSVNSK